MAKTYSFTIPIGDWSSDGHSECKWFQFTSNKSLADVREAYFAAMKKHSALSPEEFCADYQDNQVPEEIVKAAADLGYKVNPDDFWCEEMADYVAWFITLGDPELKLKRMKNLDMLPFYGYDKNKRHIGGFGYGLLGA